MTSISRVEAFPIAPRWVFVRIETDDGQVGWGESSLEGHSEIVCTAVEQFSHYLVGKNPFLIEDHWQVLSKGQFYRGGPVLSSALSGIDQALWDLLGKSLNVPIHQLLGGAVRHKIRAYGWVGGDEPSEVADQVAEQMEAGLTAVKMNASGAIGKNATQQELRQVLRRAEKVRDVLGPERDFAIDFHGRFSLASARRLVSHLDEFHPLFIEEPVLPENTHVIGRVVEATSTPIATGERLYSKQEFLPALQAGVTIVQPDVSHAGGISEMKRIASLADTFDALLAPHSPLGPLALASSLQVGFATPNFLIQEQSLGIHYNKGVEALDYVLDIKPLSFVDGYFQILTGPGLGVSIDESAVRRAASNWNGWQNPRWRHEDGSHAEW